MPSSDVTSAVFVLNVCQMNVLIYILLSFDACLHTRRPTRVKTQEYINQNIHFINCKYVNSNLRITRRIKHSVQ